MNKFVLKFFIVYILLVSTLFFGLIFFQKHQEERHFLNMQNAPDMNYGVFVPPPAPRAPQPPLAIPIFAIIIIGLVPVYVFLRYIDKNFVSALNDIKKNVKLIENDNLDVTFKTQSIDKTTKETFNLLNKMVNELKQKEILQNDLIQNIAHDLRAPIYAQERALDVLKEEYRDNEILSGLGENNELYLKMINLIIESFSTKEIRIEKIYFDLHKEVNKIIKTFLIIAKERNIEIINLIEPNFTIYADFISMNRIIANLISNAIENIENNKTIKVSAQKTNQKFIITIEDNGQGIKKEKITSLFDKYTSFNKTERKKVSGLGLYITKKLVDKNQGKISVESEENKYTRFIITLADRN